MTVEVIKILMKKLDRTEYNKVISYMCDFKKENRELKERINKAIDILGKYKHYSSPNEKQNSDNEDIVNDAYEVLKGEDEDE